MKPSKTAVEKNIAAKRKRNPLVTKLLDLKYRINDTYRLIKNRQGKPKHDLTMLGDTRIDKQWVMNLIDDVRDNHLPTLCKEDMLQCNSMWRKYE